MFLAPKKYQTSCTERRTGALIFERMYEAINQDEARARALLACMKERGRGPGELSVRAVSI